MSQTKKTESVASRAEPKSFVRRDHIRANELRIQAKWENEKIFESKVDTR